MFLFLDAHAHLYFASAIDIILYDNCFLHGIMFEISKMASLYFCSQLLLIGGQVDEALNMLEKQCCNSASVLPIRYIFLFND